MRVLPMIHAIARLHLLALLLLVWGQTAQAQESATLVADSLAVTPSGVLIADGGVEVLFGEVRMKAARVTYDREADLLTLDGPIVITDGDRIVIGADAASLDPALRNGLIRSARLVLDQQLQLAAARIDRVDGRYTQLSQAAVTSCDVCDGRPPLWSIRASRVVHDEDERQIYFENAQFRIYDFPVFWLPRMRLPDPTLERATGLLIPTIEGSNALGFGVKLPYFIVIGDSRDLTLTPYISPETRTLEARYRQAFVNGNLEVNAAVSRDDLRPDETRAYLFAKGNFALPRDFDLRFDIESTSDDDYLSTYGYSSRDLIDSRIDLTRIDRDLYLHTALISLEFLRDNLNNAQEPSLVTQFELERHLSFGSAGDLQLEVSADSLYRSEDTPGDEARDVARIGVRTDWSNRWLSDAGLDTRTRASLRVDHYDISQDDDFVDVTTRIVPSAELTLRYPLARSGADGARYLLEPLVQLAWSDVTGGPVPNEDSTQTFFDETSLTRLYRFPGEDAIEEGFRANVALGFTRIGAGGTAVRATLGRIYRSDAADGFTESSGLGGRRSDWLLSMGMDISADLYALNRTSFDDGFDVTASQSLLGYKRGSYSLEASHIFAVADPEAGRDDPISEYRLDGAWRINDAFRVAADVRYDLNLDRAANSTAAITYTNECVETRLSLSRRYASSTSIDAVTDYSVSVALRGFSAGRQAGGGSRSCRP